MNVCTNFSKILQVIRFLSLIQRLQSEIRCSVHLPSEEQLKNDDFSETDQKSGIKVQFEEINAQISFELGSCSFLQLKYSEADKLFKNVRTQIESYKDGEGMLFVRYTVYHFHR
jgi:hypothetical protein